MSTSVREVKRPEIHASLFDAWIQYNYMQTDLIRIGNSRGVRIPKAIIEQCGFGERIDMRVEDNRVILTRHRKPREGWKEALAAAKESQSSDELLLDGIPEQEFDRDEWIW